MPDEKAVIKIEVDDKASKPIKKVDSNWKTLIGSVAAGNVVANAANKAIAGIGKALRQVSDATQVAARIQVLNRVFGMTGRNAGYTTAELETTKNAIIGLGIAEQEALGIGMRFIQAQLDLADATKVARAAQDLAVISGQNSSDTAIALTDAIVKQRPILLKQYGIIADLNDIYGRQADALGKTRDELNKTEKRQAFLNEILRQSATVAGSYEAAMLDVGKRVTSLPRYLQQAQAAVGKHFLPAMAVAVDGATAFLKAIEKAFSPPVDVLVKSMAKMTETTKKFDIVTERANALRDEYVNLTEVTAPSTEQQARMVEILRELESVMPGVVLAINTETAAMRTNLEVLDDLLEKRQQAKLDKEAEMLANVGKEYERLAFLIDSWTDRLTTAKTEVFRLTQMTDEQRQSLEQQAAVLRNQLSGAYIWTAEKAEELRTSLSDIEQQLAQGTQGLVDYRNDVLNIPDKLKAWTTEHDRLLNSLSQMFPNLKDNVTVQERMNTALATAIIQFQDEQAQIAARNAARREGVGWLEYEIENIKNWGIVGALAIEKQMQAYEALYPHLKGIPIEYDLIQASHATLIAAQSKGIDTIEKDQKRAYANFAAGMKKDLDAHKSNSAYIHAVNERLWADLGFMANQGMDQIVDHIVTGRGSLRDIFKGMAQDFLKYFIKQALAFVANTFIPGLGNLLGSIFDTPANDRMAMRTGLHFAQFFSAGAMSYMGNFAEQFAAIAASLGKGREHIFSLAEVRPPGGQPIFAPPTQPSGSQIINFMGPVTDTQYVRDTIYPIIKGESEIGFAGIAIDTANLTGYDDASIG